METENINYEATQEEAEAAYTEAVKHYLRPILIEFNEYLESSCLDEFELSEDWMIEENVNNFLKDYKL